MEFKLYAHEQYKVSQWSGGTTTELAIYPAGSDYIARDFTWRLSSAQITSDVSDFTRLPDYDRILMVLEGDVVLSYDGERVIRLGPLEQDSFEGGVKTKSYGKITDYNLMMRKGCEGRLEILRLTTEKNFVGVDALEGYSGLSRGFYCLEGYGIITIEGQPETSQLLKKGEQLIVNQNVDNAAAAQIGVMGEGTIICAAIQYNDLKLGPEIIQKEKATITDFIDAATISLTNFRGSKYLFKNLKTIWYDEALKKGIDKLERAFIPFILCMAGLMVAAYCGNKLDGGAGALLAMGLWVAVDFLLITPLLYFLVLPKPIRKHIKKINSLTEYEKNVYERELGKNDRAERILKRYKITGRNVYIDDNGELPPKPGKK